MEENKEMPSQPSGEMPKMEGKPQESGKKSGGWGKAIVAFVLGLVIGAAVLLPSSTLFQGAVPGLVVQERDRLSGELGKARVDLDRAKAEINEARGQIGKARDEVDEAKRARDEAMVEVDRIREIKSVRDDMRGRLRDTDVIGKLKRGEKIKKDDANVVIDFARGRIISLLARGDMESLMGFYDILGDLIAEIPEKTVANATLIDKRKKLNEAVNWLSDPNRLDRGKHLGSIIGMIMKELNEEKLLRPAILARDPKIIGMTRGKLRDATLARLEVDRPRRTGLAAFDVTAEDATGSVKIHRMYMLGKFDLLQADSLSVSVGDDAAGYNEIPVIVDVSDDAIVELTINADVAIGATIVLEGDESTALYADAFTSEDTLWYVNMESDSDTGFVLSHMN